MPDPWDKQDLSQLTGQLLSLETLLLDPIRRANPHLITGLFAEEFREFGKSGRSYNKAEILAALRAESLPERKVAIENFEVVLLATSVALATYISVVAGDRALRSSIWVAREGEWRIVFHQGTLV